MALFYASSQYIGNLGDGNEGIFVNIGDNALETCDLEAVDDKIHNGGFPTGIKAPGINMGNTGAKGSRQGIADFLRIRSDNHSGFGFIQTFRNKVNGFEIGRAHV